MRCRVAGWLVHVNWARPVVRWVGVRDVHCCCCWFGCRGARRQNRPFCIGEGGDKNRRLRRQNSLGEVCLILRSSRGWRIAEHLGSARTRRQRKGASGKEGRRTQHIPAPLVAIFGERGFLAVPKERRGLAFAAVTWLLGCDRSVAAGLAPFRGGRCMTSVEMRGLVGEDMAPPHGVFAHMKRCVCPTDSRLLL